MPAIKLDVVKVRKTNKRLLQTPTRSWLAFLDVLLWTQTIFGTPLTKERLRRLKSFNGNAKSLKLIIYSNFEFFKILETFLVDEVEKAFSKLKQENTEIP